MARKGENIRKRSDGRWEGRYSAVNGASGKKKTKSVYARTYLEVKEKLAAARLEASKNCEQKEFLKPAGQWEESQKATFGEAASAWLADISQKRKHSTYIKYRGIYFRYLHNVVSDIPISDLDERTLYPIKRDFPEISDSLSKSVCCVANQILRYVSEHMQITLPQLSPCGAGARRKPVEVFTQAEQMRLLSYLYTDMDLMKFGIVLCLSTGLRLGEICALKWSDIDLQGQILYVRRTVQRLHVDGQKQHTVLWEDEPKSDFSKREIPLSDHLMELIRMFYSECEYVISGNRPTEPRTLQNRFQKYLICAGVEKKNFHALRHSFATNCIDTGVDIKSLSEILGHSSVTITLNRYVHPSMATKRQHMNALSSIYGQYMGQQ